MEDKPDRLEIAIRFGCGGVFGGCVALFVVTRGFQHLLFDSAAPAVAISVGIVFVFALLAARFGDRFWCAALEWGVFLWWLAVVWPIVFMGGGPARPHRRPREDRKTGPGGAGAKGPYGRKPLFPPRAGPRFRRDDHPRGF